MAMIISQVSKEEFRKAMDAAMERSYHLTSMKDEFAKEWIIELQQKIKNLQDEKGRILRATGNSAFNPLIY